MSKHPVRQGLISRMARGWLLLAALLVSCGRAAAPPRTALPAAVTGVIASLQPSPVASLTVIPTARRTIVPTASPTLAPTASPTPLFVLDLSGYDPDTFQPVDVQHRPPMIANPGETVRLAFDLVNPVYCEPLGRTCRLEPRLFYAYGEGEDFQSMPLESETREGLESLVARLPASDPEGRSLRYYAEFALPEAGYTLRYPVEGTIDLFAAPEMISIELPEANPVQPGEQVYEFLWGYGPDKVRQGVDQGGRYILAPHAISAGAGGKIALADPVNGRVLVHDPAREETSSLAIPFDNNNAAGLAFGPDGGLVICDLAGEYLDGHLDPLRACYRLSLEGEVEAQAPLYAKFPAQITKNLEILDQYDYRLVAPFSASGEASPRQSQRQKATWDLPFRYVEDEGVFDIHRARFVDLPAELAYEFHSPAGLDELVNFERTPQGYLVVFREGFDQVRAVWIDPSGGILQDTSLPQGRYTELSLYGSTAVAPDGSLYVLSSTERGVQVHLISAPQAIPLSGLPGDSQVTIISGEDLTSIVLRSCPSVTCVVVGELSAGEQALAVGMVSDGSWIQVENPDGQGEMAWVYGKLVQLSGETPPIVLVLPSSMPSLPAVAPQVCAPAGTDRLLLGYLPEHPAQLIDGGFVQSGDFIFEIWLGCDALFGPQAEYANQTSDIPGLGLHLVSSYRGGLAEGEIVEAWGVRSPGKQLPLEGEGSSQSGSLASGIATHLAGIRIPPELLPELSRPGEHPLEFVYQARNPQGEWTGALLSFILDNRPDGYYLTDVSIRPLSAQELTPQTP